MIKTYYDETDKMAHDSHIVRVKENFKLSHGGPSGISTFKSHVTVSGQFGGHIEDMRNAYRQLFHAKKDKTPI